MPGAGGIKAANYVYTVAPKDGTALGTFSVGALIDELFGTSTTSFDTAKFGWVGNMDESVGVCVVKAATGVRKFEDLLQKEVLFGGTGPAGGVTQAALALTRLYGAKIKLIKGYPGAQDVVVAMDRGEVHGVCGISIAVLKSRLAHQIKSGELRADHPGRHASRIRNCRVFRASTISPRAMTSARCSICCSAGACSAVRSRRRRAFRPIGLRRCARRSSTR